MNSNGIIRGKYFPHIDGIRTIAVLSVVVYHIFLSLCPGGFVGVDIFFVISGYLITGGILKSLENGKFSIKDFYNRRIRRIIPAYVVLIVFVLIAAILIYPPGLATRVSSTAAFSSIFSTNIFLFFNSGYFDPSAMSNPLLHLWSLGVEEQFYIFTPVFLLLAFKTGRRFVFPALLVVTVLSLVLSIVCNYFNFNDFNFYMLPTRTWELMAGSIFAYWNRVKPVNTLKAGLIRSFGFSGIVIAVIVCFVYDSNTVFPGLTAIPPVAAALLMIRWGNIGPSKVILESKPFVGIGRISYSLYLWHWPLIVFWNYVSDDSKNPWGLVVVFVLSFVMGWLSWRFVEMPVRLSRMWSFRKAMLWVIFGCGCIGATASVLRKFDLIEYRVAETMQKLRKTYWNGPASSFCDFPDSLLFNIQRISENHSPLVTLGDDKDPAYLLWGDSHALALSPGFNQFSQHTKINGLYFNYNVTLMDKVVVDQYKPYNDKLIEATLNWIGKHSELKTIILVNRWACNSEGLANELPLIKINFHFANDLSDLPSDQIMEIGLKEICRKLKQMGRNVIIISSIPEQGFDVLTRCYKNKLFGLSLPRGISRGQFEKRQKNVFRILRDIEGESLAKVIRVDDFFFSGSSDCFISSEDNQPLYLDDDHLSPDGACKLVQHYSDQIEKAMRKGR